MNAPIAFLGNSLTSGRHGAAYLPRVEAALPGTRIINAGIGGDTFANLLRRAESEVLAHSPSAVVVQSGLNDVITAWLPTQSHPRAAQVLENFFRRNKKADLPMTPEVFARNVRALLDRLRSGRPELPVLVCTMTLMGEDLAQGCSLLADDYDRVLRATVRDCGCEVLDVTTPLRAELDGLPPRAFDLTEVDFIGLKPEEKADELARERGYRLTYDGLHFNTRAAEVMARAVADRLRGLAASW